MLSSVPADARQMRRSLDAFAADLEHRGERSSRVLPPAPNVTEQNAGFSCASCARAARAFTPSGVRGGKTRG